MKIDKVREIGGGRYELTLIPSLYFAREGNKDQNHFPIDEKTGEHVALFNDKERTKAIIIFGESDIIKTKEGNGVALIFNIKDTTEVRKAGNTFSAIFSNGFTEKVKMINEISVNNEKYYTPNPLKIPYIPMYLDNVGHWLEYLKNVFGFDFKQYVYNEFCKRILNYRVNYESGLYSGEIPQTHINAVKIWIESQDKIIQREAEFFKYSKISDSQHKTNQNKTSLQQKGEKVIAPFHSHLNHSLPEELAEICKTIFNRNSSPKDYAIMLCLLSESGIVLIPNKKRTDFYLSWYSFIGEPLPKKNNFYGINKNIVDKSVSGFVFHDEADQDYCHLQSTFEQARKSIENHD